jgi:hypothetical protein
MTTIKCNTNGTKIKKLLTTLYKEKNKIDIVNLIITRETYHIYL